MEYWCVIETNIKYEKDECNQYFGNKILELHKYFEER